MPGIDLRPQTRHLDTSGGVPRSVRVDDENILVIGDLEAQSAAERAAQGQIAQFARAEIDRIISTYGQPLP